MADNTLYTYDETGAKDYLENANYSLEDNALITEKQVNIIAKDIRDYLQDIKKVVDVAVTYNGVHTNTSPDNKSDEERLNAWENLDITNHIEAVSQVTAAEVAQQAINNWLNGTSQAVNLIETGLANGANVYYLTGAAHIGQYGIPITAEYFRDLQPSDIFYHKDSFNSITTGNLNDITDSNGLLPESMDEDLKNKYRMASFNLYGSENYTSQGIQQKGHPGLVVKEELRYIDGTDTTSSVAFTQESSFMKAFTQYYHLPFSSLLPKLLKNIKSGDFLWDPTNKKVYQVISKAENSNMRVPITLTNSNKSPITDYAETLYAYRNQSAYKNIVNKVYFGTTENLPYQNSAFIQFFNSPQNGYHQFASNGGFERKDVYYGNRCIYLANTLNADIYSNITNVNDKYPYGSLAIYCKEINFEFPRTIWRYNDTITWGDNEEYFDNLSPLFKTSVGNSHGPAVGDYIYNPLSQEIREIVRDLCISEVSQVKGSTRKTYLTKPIIQVASSENVITRGTGTYFKGNNFFIMPDYCISYDSGGGSMFAAFDHIINGTNYDTDEYRTVIFEKSSQLSLVKIEESSSDYTYRYEEGLKTINEDGANVLLNAYFALPLKAQQESDMGACRFLQQCNIKAGDVIFFKNAFYQAVDRPRLLEKYLDTTDIDIADVTANLLYYKIQIAKTHSITYPLDIKYESGHYYFYTDSSQQTETSLAQWLENNDIDDNTILSYAQGLETIEKTDEYIEDLYHRLLTNLFRPIVVEVEPIGMDIATGGDGTTYTFEGTSEGFIVTPSDTQIPQRVTIGGFVKTSSAEPQNIGSAIIVNGTLTAKHGLTVINNGINVMNNRIQNVTMDDNSPSSDATNKAYVDSKVNQITLGANKVSYTSASDVYDVAPSNVSDALAGLENAVQTQKKLWVFNSQDRLPEQGISETISQYYLFPDGVPNVGDCLIDVNSGRTGTITAISAQYELTVQGEAPLQVNLNSYNYNSSNIYLNAIDNGKIYSCTSPVEFLTLNSIANTTTSIMRLTASSNGLELTVPKGTGVFLNGANITMAPTSPSSYTVIYDFEENLTYEIKMRDYLLEILSWSKN